MTAQKIGAPQKRFPHNIAVHSNAKNVGIAGNHNIGLNLAQGGYIARLDQDDFWIAPDKLERQINFLEENPETGVVGTWCRARSNDGSSFDLELPIDDLSVRKRMMFASMFFSPSVVFRRQIQRTSSLALVMPQVFSQSLRPRRVERRHLSGGQ